MIIKKCLHCEEDYKAKTNRSRFCSKYCTDALYQKQNKDKCAKKAKKYYSNNRDNVQMVQEVWREKNPTWAQIIKKRDNHCCQICDSTEDLHAHHILHRAIFQNLIKDINNGLTLCSKCHKNRHTLDNNLNRIVKKAVNKMISNQGSE